MDNELRISSTIIDKRKMSTRIKDTLVDGRDKMKTCLILEIKNNKAIVLAPDGEVIEVPAEKGWQVGQTVSPKRRVKKAKPVFVAVACLMFALVIITPIATSFNDDVTFDNDGETPIVARVPDAEPEVKNTKVEPAGKDYKNVYNVINASEDIVTEVDCAPLEDTGDSEVLESSSKDMAKAESSEPDYSVADGKGSDSIEYSETNNQVKNVEEADIIKTDGKYIYALNRKNLVILEDNNGNPKLLKKIKQKQANGIYFEMYIQDNKLMLVANTVKELDSGEKRTMSKVVIYDVTDPAKPKKINTLSQSGAYSDSRITGGYLYLISSHNVKKTYLKKNKVDTYVPEISEGGKTEVIDEDSITMCPVENHPTYTVVGSINIKSPDKYKDTISFLGNSSDIYSSEKNIYISSIADEEMEDTANGTVIMNSGTQLTKIGFSEGKLKKPISAVIPGVSFDQFNMDEYNGNLRMVNNVEWYSYSTSLTPREYDDFYSHKSYDEGQYTALFVLDEKLNEIGKIVNLAPDEDLYSCRFMGDYAYFVTFRNVDPLFTADLSNPKKPKVIGKLKIPGFSDYLHPYEKGLLLGVGSDADEDSGDVGDLKISMFDNSNPANVKEKHTLVIHGYSYTEVSENHKAILVDAKKKLIAFPSVNTYLVYTYDKKSGFKQIGKMEYKEDYAYRYSGNIIRGLYINNNFYVITPNTIKTFDMSNKFKTKTTLSINNNAEPVNEYAYMNNYWDDVDDDIVIHD